MSGTAVSGLLGIITAAVTPVVMLSAVAVLITSVNGKHAAISDRLRALALEFRSGGTSTARKQVIRDQVRLFASRARYVAAAHRALYAAAVCFTGMTLVIAVTPRARIWDQLSLGIFVLGITLVLCAVAVELLDLRLADRTLLLELSDVLKGERSGGSGGTDQE